VARREAGAAREPAEEPAAEEPVAEEPVAAMPAVVVPAVAAADPGPVEEVPAGAKATGSVEAAMWGAGLTAAARVVRRREADRPLSRPRVR
jgi:hypothetical protein